MKYVVLMVCLASCASARDNIHWSRFLEALADVESTGGTYMTNRREDAWGWYQMRRLARIDANTYIGTQWKKWHLISRPVANQMFMAYAHKYRDKWSTRTELVHLWHLGPNWKNRLYKDYGYAARFEAALRKRER